MSAYPSQNVNFLPGPDQQGVAPFLSGRSLNQPGGGGGDPFAARRIGLQQQDMRFGQQMQVAQLGEGQRQFNAQLGEGQRQFNAQHGLLQQQFGEGVRQFDLTHGLQQQQFGLQQYLAATEDQRAGERHSFDMARNAAADRIAAQRERLGLLQKRLYGQKMLEAEGEMLDLDDQYLQERQLAYMAMEDLTKKEEALAGVDMLQRMIYATSEYGPDGKPTARGVSFQDRLYNLYDEIHGQRAIQAQVMAQEIHTLFQAPFTNAGPASSEAPGGGISVDPNDLPEEIRKLQAKQRVSLSGALSAGLARAVGGYTESAPSAVQGLIGEWLDALDQDLNTPEKVRLAAEKTAALRKALGPDGFNMTVAFTDAARLAEETARRQNVELHPKADGERDEARRSMEGEAKTRMLRQVGKALDNAQGLVYKMQQHNVTDISPQEVEVGAPSVIPRMNKDGKIEPHRTGVGMPGYQNVIDQALMKMYEFDPDGALQVLDQLNNPTMRSRFEQTLAERAKSLVLDWQRDYQEAATQAGMLGQSPAVVKKQLADTRRQRTQEAAKEYVAPGKLQTGKARIGAKKAREAQQAFDPYAQAMEQFLQEGADQAWSHRTTAKPGGFPWTKP